MDQKTANKCIQLTTEFYKEVAASFSETRQSAWSGWEKALEFVSFPEDFKLLDVACGNLRFEKFLESFGVTPSKIVCVDNCEEFGNFKSGTNLPYEFNKVDLLKNFGKSKSGTNFSNEKFDLVVCFGFFHHIPGKERRAEFLKKLILSLAQISKDQFPHLIISFWEFMKDERIAKKAIETTERVKEAYGLSLDENDYFLGWRDREDVFRYCHNFSDGEIEAMVEEVTGVELVTSFLEDGKNHDLNRYVVLKASL